MYKKVFIFILANTLCLPMLQAQDDCTLTLKKAQKLFDDGSIEKVSELIHPCLDQLPTQEKLQALKLLTMTYLFEDKNADAENTLLTILKIDPEFKINYVADPKEFIELVESFRTSPVFSLGAFGGINMSNVNVIHTYSMDNNSAFGKYTNDGLGFQFGLNFNFYLKDHLELCAEAMMIGNKIQYNNTLFGFANVNLKESQTSLRLPITCTYDFGKGNLKSFARIGLATGYLLSSTAAVTRKYEDNSFADVTGPNISLANHRKSFNYWVVVGAGLKYKIKKGNLVLDIRYNYGLTNVVNPQSRFLNSTGTINELSSRYYYLDSDFKLNDFAVSVGYVYSFYNAKKKNN